MNRWLLSTFGAEVVAHVGLALIIIGLIAEALFIVDALTIGVLSDRTDKVLTAIFTSAIAVGVWLEHIGNKEASDKKDALLNQLRQQRRLTKEQSEALTPLLKSDFFQKDPKPALRVGSVKDVEAQMYAMDFQRLLESCAVNIYPTSGGLPTEVVQLEPSADGLQLKVKSMNNPTPAFVHFQRLVHSLGINIPVGEEPSFRDNEAMLEVLKRKP